MHPSRQTGYILCVAAAVVWSGTGPGLSYLMDTHGTHPLLAALWRDLFIAVACLAGVAIGGMLSGRGLPRLSLGELRGFALMGAISVGVYHALFVTSIAINGAALGIVLIYLYPAFVTLGARIFFKEAIGLQQLVALGMALAGTALLVRIYDPAVLQASWLGVLAGLGSAITHAGYVLFNQRAVARHSPWLSLALTMSFGSLALLLLTVVILGPAQVINVGSGGATPWLILLALALGPTLGGYAFFTMSLRHLPGQIASLIVVIEAPITTVAAILLLGERIDALQTAGMVLIISAAVLSGLPLSQWRRPAVAAAD